MFDLDIHKVTISDMPDIVDNFEALHFDEYPILYIGTNNYRNKIIGSLICEDEDLDDVFRYIHIVVDDKTFWSFLNRKLSYREVIINSRSLYVIDKDINGKSIRTYNVEALDIPGDYLPLPTAYCPDYSLRLGFDFSISLKGLIANLNEAMIETSNSVTKSFGKIIDTAIGSIQGLNLKAKVLQIPSTTGSFKINLKIKLVDYNDLFVSSADISTYIGKYVQYCIQNLPHEIKQLLDDDKLNDDKFTEISDDLRSIYTKSSREFTNDDNEKLKENVIKTLQKVEDLSDELGNGFNEIVIDGKTESYNHEFPIALIDNSKKHEINDAVEYVLSQQSEGIVTDDVDKQYLICIYELNTSTRSGFAYIANELDPLIMDKPRIMILGDNELSNTRFTESLHLNRWIQIIGKAKRVNGKFRKITIMGEFT